MPRTIWRQTPDGRPSAALPAEDHSAEALEPTAREVPRIPALEPFVEGCAAALPELSDGDSGPRLGFSLFLLGAADRFWERSRLDDGRFPAYAEGLLRRLGMNAPEAATLAASTPRLAEADERAREALAEGAETLDAWLDSHDSNLFLRLTELVPRWRRLSVG
jgi:hypothetical protein